MSSGWGSLVWSVLAAIAVTAAAWGSISERQRIDTGSIAKLEARVESLEREKMQLVIIAERLQVQTNNQSKFEGEVRGEFKELNAKLAKRGIR